MNEREEIAKVQRGELSLRDFYAMAFAQAARNIAARQPAHTDIFLGDDGRGHPFWKIICRGRIQEVKAPLPKGYKCVFCHEPIALTTSVLGVDPKDLVEDTSSVVIERFTKETVKRVLQDAKDRRVVTTKPEAPDPPSCAALPPSAPSPGPEGAWPAPPARGRPAPAS